MSIDVYTDGGCSGNPGPGGWAYVILERDHRKTVSGGKDYTTNNRMELTAVLEALKGISSHERGKLEKIRIFTDSQYVQKGMTVWIIGWLRNGWKTSSKKPVKNRDLWMDLHAIAATLNLEWHWLKGHAGHELNELCDARVQEEIANICRIIETQHRKNA